MWIFLYFGRIGDCGKKLVITEGLGINRMSGILLEAVALEGRGIATVAARGLRVWMAKLCPRIAGTRF